MKNRTSIWLVFPLIACTTVPARSGVPAGQDATRKTRETPDALKALQQGGKVFFEEDFESPDWQKKFFDHNGLKDGRLSPVTEPRLVCRGKSSLRCRLPKGPGAVASACAWFAPGYDKVHLRWYSMFAEDFDQGNLMHFVGLSAVAGSDRYAEMGKAGIRPTGTDRFTTGFEPWRGWGTNAPPGVMNFYSYFPTMKEDPKMKGKYWGNQFVPARPFIPTRGKWHCFEIMLKANDPDKENGEQAAWIDGELYAHFTLIRWRKSDQVRIKRLYLGVYIHDNPKENVVFFDDVALSTGYIGPVKE